MSAKNDFPSPDDYKALAVVHLAQWSLVSATSHPARKQLAAELERAVLLHKAVLSSHPRAGNLVPLLLNAVDSIRSDLPGALMTLEALADAVEAIYPYDLIKKQSAYGDDLLLIADLDALPPLVLTELLAALDELHRAYGGGGLIISTAHTGSAASAVGAGV